MATKKAATEKTAAKKSASKVSAAVSKKSTVIKPVIPAKKELATTLIPVVAPLEEPDIDELPPVIDTAEKDKPTKEKKDFFSHKEALAELKKGKVIMRKEWPTDEYLEIIEGTVYRSVTAQRKDLYVESLEDNTALDWLVK